MKIPTLLDLKGAPEGLRNLIGIGPTIYDVDEIAYLDPDDFWAAAQKNKLHPGHVGVVDLYPQSSELPTFILDKTKYRIRFEDETEQSVKVIIERK